MGACSCHSRAKERARQALQDAVASGEPEQLESALEQAQAAKMHQHCTEVRVARAAKAHIDDLSAQIIQLLSAANKSDDLAVLESALVCASTAHVDGSCKEVTMAKARATRLQAIAALRAATLSGNPAELEKALELAASLHIEEDLEAMQAAKTAQVRAALRIAAGSGSREEIEVAIEQARLVDVADECVEMQSANAALVAIARRNALEALRDATESGDLLRLEAALRTATAAEVDETCREVISARAAALEHAPVPLVVKGLASVDSEAVLRMTKPRDLPEELLLQQEIMSVPGGIDCFHCGGSGSLFTRRRRRLEDAINAARDGIDITAAQNAVAVIWTGGSVRTGENKTSPDVGMDDVVLDMQTTHIDQEHSDVTEIQAEKAMWLFEDGAGGWGIFDEHMAAKLEEAWWDGVGAILQLKGPRFMYQVDLDTMVQENIRTGKRRRVQRLAVEEPLDDSMGDIHEPFTNPVFECPSMSPSEDSAHPPMILGEQLPRSIDNLHAGSSNSAACSELLVDIRLSQEAASSGHCGDNDEAEEIVVGGGRLERLADSCERLLSTTRVDDWARFVKEVMSNAQSRPADQEETPDGAVVAGEAEAAIAPAMGPAEDPLAEAAASAEAATKEEQPTRQCWVCRGTGKTSKWLSGFQPHQLNSSGDSPCLVCYGDSHYGLSVECDHYYCRDCIGLSLEAIMSSGQFPAFCPQCRATAQGTPAIGRIEDVALSFLVQREVISEEFFLRFSRQQQASEVPGVEQAFECPAQCGRFLLQDDPSYANRFGASYTVGRIVSMRLGQCPCGTRVCAWCHQTAEGSTHHCPEQERPELPSDPETLKLLGQIGKKCPKCGLFIEKNEGCMKMTCGTKAHGRLVDCLRNGGCGCAFEWSTLRVCDDSYTDLDDVRKGGRVITARQIPGHPKCARVECRFFKTVDDLFEPKYSSKQARNNGGEYCCDACCRGPAGSHSHLCHQIRFYLPSLPPAPP